MLLVNNYNPYLMNTEILNYCKYLAFSIQHSWNVTCKQLQPIPVTAAGVVPCGGRKTSPRTSTIVQFIFYFGPFRSAIIF